MPRSQPRSRTSAPSNSHESIESHTTPKVKHTTSLGTNLNAQSAADPNEGRCLLTDRPIPVKPYHLVPQASDDETLTKLEYVWEVGYQWFDVDAKCNVMHLRLDWLMLFDDAQWMLVPEANILQELSKIYLEDKQPTHDLPKLYAKKTFRYYILPAPTLQEPICRYSDSERHSCDTDAHSPPYATLGPLTSHVHPYFVVFNSGQKMLRFEDADVVQMVHSLSQTPAFSSEDATQAVCSIQELYRAWSEVQVPDGFAKEDVPSNQDGA